jgi:uncharacterized protein (TIGR03382 family)
MAASSAFASPRPFVASIVACVTMCVACGAPSDEGADESSAVQGGRMDTSATHAFAVGIATRAGAVCSGTLIAPNLVLTARHCVEEAKAPDTVTCANRFSGQNVQASTLFVSTEARLRGAKNFYVAKEIVTPAATEFCGNDIALVVLEKNIPETEAIPAIPVVFPMTDRSRISGKVTAMGYGITNPAADDSGVRRIRQNIDLLCVEGDAAHACTSHYASMIDVDREFVTAGYVCAGDSGGGAFDQDSLAKGAPYVLGALSRGPETDDQCLAAIYSRTDAHARMIVQVATKAAARGGYPPPAWLGLDLAPLPADPPCGTETCVPPPPVEQPMEQTTTIHRWGCSAAPSSPAPTGQLAAIGALAAVALMRRRRA